MTTIRLTLAWIILAFLLVAVVEAVRALRRMPMSKWNDQRELDRAGEVIAKDKHVKAIKRLSLYSAILLAILTLLDPTS